MTNYLETITDFLELIIIFFGGVPPQGIKCRQPRAYHLARWMTKAIYFLKIFMFKDQFKINHKEEQALKEVCYFIVKSKPGFHRQTQLKLP